MYRQILVLPKYRKFQHILRRSSSLDELKEYQLNTLVTYGGNCAPVSALRVFKDIANHVPAVRDGLLRQTYVNDICTGADRGDELSALQCDLCATLKRAGLELKKMLEKLQIVLELIPAEDRAVDFRTLDDRSAEVVKVLRLQWDPCSDVFHVNVLPITAVVTKRPVIVGYRSSF